MSLVVVTDNGQPPTGKPGGGKRIGYAGVNAFVFLPDANVAAYLAILAAQQQAQRLARARELREEAKQRQAEEDRQLQEYLSLPRARGWRQRCNKCDSEKTSHGRKAIGENSRPIVTCNMCGNIMRPCDD